MASASPTIVSAFFTNINTQTSEWLSKYIEFGRLMLRAKINKIIFISEDIYDYFDNDSNEFTVLIPVKKSDIYLYDYQELLTKFSLNTNNPKKDTFEYMFLMCSKTEWVAKAIELNCFNSDNYIWVDFRIKHMFTCDDNEFIRKIERLKTTNYDRVRIASIWNPNELQCRVNIYRDISWYFAGSMFGGGKFALLVFARLMREKCIHIMREQNSIMWEVNIWYLLYRDCPQLFDLYSGGHDNTIADNY
jgi:hypothetical protein